MKKSLLLLTATAAVASGCYSVENTQPGGLGSFRVVVQSVSAVNGSDTQELAVVPACIRRYGNATEQVPADVRGTRDCPYVAPTSPVELTLDVTALDKNGQPYGDFNGPVALQVEPGTLAGDYQYYWMQLDKGRGTDTVRAQYLYGEVRVWVKDERFEPNYVDGNIVYYTDAGSADPAQFPREPDAGRTYAAGASGPVFFAEPSLASIQRPQVADNRSSPFVGQFVTIGRAPEAGPALFQNCPDIDVDGDGKVDPQEPKPMMLLVTGTDPSGFYVTDITACRIPDPTEPPKPGEKIGYLPGTFGSMYIYNYSFPEGLDPGDLLWTLAGSLQEFTSTTQLTFPSWTVREHVRELPPAQWNKYLNLNPPVELNLRHCGAPNTLSPGPVDKLCAFYTDNMKLESLESALVKVHHVRFPEVFTGCDKDGNGEVTMFCSRSRQWTYCSTSEPPKTEMDEVTCNIACTTGTGAFQNKVCSERTSYNGFGQFVIELPGPGPRAFGLDESLSERLELAQELNLTDTASRIVGQEGTAMSIWCDVATDVRFGATAADTAKAAYTPLPARTRKYGEGYVDFKAQQTPSSAAKCVVARNNTGTRMLLTTRDAVPELRVDCDENDSDADRAQQCRLMRQATYDVVGHLKQIQAARPRWLINPRDVDDLCCHPGPAGQCPRPIKPCQ
jgi:hypothetical protein